MADVFDNAVPPEWRRDLLHMIGRNTDLDWLLLTKRIGNAARMLNEAVEALACGNHDWDFMPWSDIWLGATVCNQEEVDRDVPKLLAVNAAVRFLSIEPMLGPVNLAPHLGMWWNSTMDCWEGTGQYINRDQWGRKGIHWVIVGGETGHGARPIAERWVRDVQRQCQAAGVAFLFKQWGEWIPARQAPSQMVQAYLQKYRAYPTGFADGERVLRLGRGFAGRLFDEREWDAWPR
jgi:protein gp37